MPKHDTRRRPDKMRDSFISAVFSRKAAHTRKDTALLLITLAYARRHEDKCRRLKQTLLWRQPDDARRPGLFTANYRGRSSRQRH